MRQHVTKEERADIDSRVLQAIAQEYCVLAAICACTALKARVVDRSLQRLRKQRKIEYGGTRQTFSGWRVRSALGGKKK
jgi:hypothetical protein